MNHPPLSVVDTFFAGQHMIVWPSPRLCRVFSETMKFFPISVISSQHGTNRLRDDIKWKDLCKQGNICLQWLELRKFVWAFSPVSPSPLHSLATISLTTKTQRGRLTFDFRIGIVCLFRWIPENGEMNWELVSGIPDNISACFSLYINFNRLLCHLTFLDMYNSAQVFQHRTNHWLQKQLWERLRWPVLWWVF